MVGYLVEGQARMERAAHPGGKQHFDDISDFRSMRLFVTKALSNNIFIAVTLCDDVGIDALIF